MKNFILEKYKIIIAALVVIIVGVVILVLATGSKDSKPADTPAPTTEAMNTVAPTEVPVTPTEAPAPTETPTPTPDPSHEGMVRSPLNNEYVDAKYENMRPVALMFNNIKQGAPQVGITDCGVVYECLVEGGITRLMGVMTEYDKQGDLGSIRSARSYYCYWAMEWDSIYTHIGGPQKYVKDILSQMDDLDGIASYGIFFYVKNRVSPHNEFTSGANIVDGIKRYKVQTEYTANYKGEHLKFADDATPTMLEDGIDATVVKPGYEYNYPEFTYNAEDGLYYRKQFGAIHIDETTGKQLTAKNIIIQYADYEQLDHNGYLAFTVKDKATGWYITNGKAIEITWEKTEDRAPTKFFDKNGNEIRLNTGTTWIQVCPKYYKDKNTKIQ